MGRPRRFVILLGAAAAAVATPNAALHLRLGPSIVTSEADVDAAVQAVHALA